MLNNHASDEPENGRFVPFLASNSPVPENQVSASLPGRAPRSPETFRWFGRCSASVTVSVVRRQPRTAASAGHPEC
jgi:hypothetical protein